MKVVKVVSKSGSNRMQVITDEGTTKHIEKVGSNWMYLHGKKFNEHKEIVKDIRIITFKKGESKWG